MGYSDCRVGSKILISKTREMTLPVVGFITRVWNSGVDAIGFPNGKAIYYSGIWSCDDPRLDDLTGDELILRLERGVFKVCDYDTNDISRLEDMVNSLSDGVAQLKKAVEEYAGRLDVVERALFGLEEPSPGGEG